MANLANIPRATGLKADKGIELLTWPTSNGIFITITTPQKTDPIQKVTNQPFFSRN
jgi:hypothetical protein